MTQRTGRFPRRRQPKNFTGRLQQVLLHPVEFFRHLPLAEDTRHWLWVAILILALTGYSAVRQQSPSDTFSAVEESDALVVGLKAVAPMVLAWLTLTGLLGLVTMLRGHRPEFFLNFRAAIWASLPFGLMAILQLFRLFTGYAIQSQGITSVFTAAQGWDNFSPTLQIFIINITRHLTIFGLWQTVLLYLGGRYTLRGKWWASLLVIVLWLLVLVLFPTLWDISRLDT